MSTQATSLKRWLRRAAVVAVLAAAVAVAYVGGRWYEGLLVEEVAVEGTLHAEPDSLLRLAGLAEGSPLHLADPELVADRVRRHPWVAEAEVARRLTGTVRVEVRERTPVALALGADGRAAYYLDADGAMLPVPEHRAVAFHVPLVRGLEEAYHPVRRIEHEGLRALLATLPGTSAEALVSEVELRGDDLWLWADPGHDRPLVPVHLGHGDPAPKLRRLTAFWQQAVLNRPHVRFDRVDLRFPTQVVTEEEATS